MRAMREGGFAPQIKKAGGRQKKSNGVIIPSNDQIKRERQIQRSKTGRKSMRERVIEEQRDRDSYVSNNTGRGLQRSDGQFRRLPRESRDEFDYRMSRNQEQLQEYFEEDDGELEEEEEQQQEPLPPPPKPVSRRSRRTAAAATQVVSAPAPPPPPTAPVAPTTSSTKRAFVVVPTFDSPITISTSPERLEEYAKLCAADSREKGESPVLSRQFISYTPTTYKEKQAITRDLLDTWMESADLVVLYTDLGVTPYLSEVIQWANKTGKTIDFRLLGDKWVQSLSKELEKKEEQEQEEEEEEEEEEEPIPDPVPQPPKPEEPVAEKKEEEEKQEEAPKEEEKEKETPPEPKKPARRGRRRLKPKDDTNSALS